MEKGFYTFLEVSELKAIITECLSFALENCSKQHQHNASPNNDLFLTRSEVAKALHISLPTLRDYTKRGLLTSNRIGSRVLYKKEELDKSITEIINIKYKKGI